MLRCSSHSRRKSHISCSSYSTYVPPPPPPSSQVYLVSITGFSAASDILYSFRLHFDSLLVSSLFLSLSYLKFTFFSSFRLATNSTYTKHKKKHVMHNSIPDTKQCSSACMFLPPPLITKRTTLVSLILLHLALDPNRHST